ncbi:hypothetical protein PFISCL1PPCAC_1744, partial [Pristionchus fissidentatus]
LNYFLVSSSLTILLIDGCCTPDCCCEGCSSCNNPVTDRCNKYACTRYNSVCNGQQFMAPSRLSPSGGGYTANNAISQNYQSVQKSVQNGGCNCRGDQPVVPPCICPDSTGSHTFAIGTRFVHKETCYGYDYCLLGLPGWVTIICSILLLLIFIILLFYCISCLVHYLII